MRRFALLLLTQIALAAISSGTTRAQTPSLPMALDLGKVALGSWSEYELSLGDGKSGPLKQRFALVGRGPKAHELELTMDLPPTAPGRAGHVTVKVDLDVDATRADRVRRVVMQVGGGNKSTAPMEMPLGSASPAGQFGKVDPKKQVGTQEISVPAGSFKTKHYRDKLPDGGTIEYWVSDEVPPFGLVKMKLAGAGGSGGGPATMHLVARGRGAKSAITRPPRPFDQVTLMNELAAAAKPGPTAQP